MTQEEADTGEGKRYYQRIPVDKESGTIVGGLGNKLNGTNIKDLSENLKNVKEDKPLKMSDGESGNIEKKEEKKPEQVKANSEAEKKNREFVNKVKDIVVKTPEQEERYNQYKDDVVKILDKYGTTPQDRRFIQEEFIKSVADRYFSTPMSDLIKHLESVSTDEAWQERKQKYDDDVESVRKSLDELKEN
jgi:hypothetical protein